MRIWGLDEVSGNFGCSTHYNRLKWQTTHIAAKMADSTSNTSSASSELSGADERNERGSDHNANRVNDEVGEGQSDFADSTTSSSEEVDRVTSNGGVCALQSLNSGNEDSSESSAGNLVHQGGEGQIVFPDAHSRIYSTKSFCSLQSLSNSGNVDPDENTGGDRFTHQNDEIGSGDNIDRANDEGGEGLSDFPNIPTSEKDDRMNSTSVVCSLPAAFDSGDKDPGESSGDRRDYQIGEDQYVTKKEFNEKIGTLYQKIETLDKELNRKIDQLLQQQHSANDRDSGSKKRSYKEYDYGKTQGAPKR